MYIKAGELISKMVTVVEVLFFTLLVTACISAILNTNKPPREEPNPDPRYFFKPIKAE
jgi:hypothetical protein